ncbi:MAG TPA: ribonuclease III [Bacteroidota bacterium]|nr:ribonuclease III [Bacteroidota bacterium]
MGVLRTISARIKGVFGARPPHPLSGIVPIVEFQKALSYTIVRPELFREALSHRSYSQTPMGAGSVSNERLEFLGDAVLNLLVAEYLFGAHTLAPEGELTKVRARLVNGKALALYAKNLGLEGFLLRSPQTDQLSGRGLETILSDAYEAVVGAIYLDGGYEAARAFVAHTAIAAFTSGTIGALDENYKSMLLEHAQADGLGVPRYMTVGEHGPDHDRTFTVEVQLGRQPYGTGSGKNKKDAEQEAARSALKTLGVIG